MYPELFHIGSFTVYTYGVMIAFGALLSFWYLNTQGKKLYHLTFDQSNTLFVILVFASVVGGKLFIIFEDPALYLQKPSLLFSRSGFVFYGSFITAVPIMLWYIRRLKVPMLGMLDIIAGVACIVHGIGRLGCFFAGCCHGKPTDVAWAITYTHPTCVAEPMNTPLHPSPLYETLWIGVVFVIILLLRKKFDGQKFFVYVMLYAIGRFVLDYFRGDSANIASLGNLTNAQITAVLLFLFGAASYVILWKRARNSDHRAHS